MRRPALPALALLVSGCVPELTSPTSDDTGSTSTWVAPDNDWPSATPPAGLVGQGYGQGQVMPDFRLNDQFGQEVALWQFYGSVIVLDLSTMWCGPCAALAKDVTETWHDYQSQGFMYLTVLPEDDQGQVPDQSDLQRWAENNGVEAPILADDQGLAYQMVPDAAWPRIYVLDRTMKVAVEQVNPATDAAIRAAVEDLL